MSHLFVIINLKMYVFLIMNSVAALNSLIKEISTIVYCSTFLISSRKLKMIFVSILFTSIETAKYKHLYTQSAL